MIEELMRLADDYASDYARHCLYPDAKSEKLSRAALATALEAVWAENERLRAELDARRKSGSASDRLHNICEALSEDMNESPFTREEWDRIDAENAALRKEIKELRAAMEKPE